VLVTGATGFTGAVLTRKLVDAGLSVRAIARMSSDLSPLEDLAIRWFRGDNYDAEVVQAAAEGVAYIFNVAAAYRAAGIGDAMYHKVHVEGTQRLAEAALGNPDFKRFVHVSTIGVHSHIDNPPADEDYPFQPDDIYQATKAEAELWIRDFARERNLPFTVIRPAAIMGPDDRRLLKFFRMAAKGRLVLLGQKDMCYHLIHVEDLANVLMLAATHPGAEGEVFICGNERPISFREMGAIIARAVGCKLRVVRVPAAPVFLAAALCENLCKPFGWEPPLHRRRVAFFTKNRAFDTTKMRETLGYEPIYDNESGIGQTARAYREKGWM
jgi:nucleoside-diphosphate-sugar epimerase